MINQAILAGDIGGTKTTLALYGQTGEILRETTFKNYKFDSLQAVISSFLTGLDYQPTRACFGIAGPVKNNRVRMTNLDWIIDGKELADHFALEHLLLVNDLVATTAGAVLLPADSLVTINNGRPDPKGTIGVLAPGTGLGQSFAVRVNNRLQPFPSEGGHCSFAPRNREQIELLQFMLEKRPHVSVEQVCSGMVIPDLYAFMTMHSPEPEWLAQKRAESDDQTPVIVQAANDARAGSPACDPAVRTVQLFVDILAAEAANLALKVLATGGIYLGGGMPPRLLSFFDQERFMHIFCRGVYREMLADIPVHIIRDPKTALIGARELAVAEETLRENT
ncbi:MAG: glucokinase [Thermodesulfobacteriota bacterium]|nr:glucokinase [Thermodesulfobacteriota bacterium]